MGHNRDPDAGRGRIVPLNASALKALQSWALHFPDREPTHFVFASERYGIAGNNRTPSIHAVDPTKPIKSLKEAWESAKDAACFSEMPLPRPATHSLHPHGRAGRPRPVIASLFGWSTGTTVRMARRYGTHRTVGSRGRGLCPRHTDLGG